MRRLMARHRSGYGRALWAAPGHAYSMRQPQCVHFMHTYGASFLMRAACYSVLHDQRAQTICDPRPCSSRHEVCTYAFPVIVCHPCPSSTPFTFFVPRTHIRRNALLTLLRAIATEQAAVVSPVSPSLLPRPAFVELSASPDFTSELSCTYTISLLFASSGTYDQTLSVTGAGAIDQHCCVRRVVRHSEVAVAPQRGPGPLDRSSAGCTSCACAGPETSAIAHEFIGVPSHIWVL